MVPIVSKTANGTYDEVHTWTLNKTVDPTSQSGLAGQTKNFTWTITVGKSEEDKNFAVSGVITVVNPNPDDPMTVTLSDELNDGSVAAIGPCEGGTLVGDQLTIPAGGTATCEYSATPTGRYNLNALAAALPNQVTMSVQYPYEGAPAYFNTIVTDGGALNGSYEGWCVDTDHVIYQNTPYTANVFSSYESLPAGLVEFPQNFDLVNWIINQDFVDKSAAPLAGNYTYGDVQRAIWELIDDTASTSGLGTWSQAHVNQIKALAQANGEGFMPTCGDMVAVVLQPVGGTVQTITIAQVTFASLGVNCADTNVVTAVLNGIPFEASKLITWEAHPINPIATLTDEQGPLTEELTSSEVFTIPDSYTCPVDPDAYTDGIYTYPEDNTATLSTVAESAQASTEVTCYYPSIEVTKTANPISVPEPGGNVLFTFVVKNTSTQGPVTITSLSDNVYGPLAGDADCKVDTLLAVGASCEFSETYFVAGDASDPDHVNVFTAVVKNSYDLSVTDNDNATVGFTDVAPTVTLDKSVDIATLPEPGGVFTFTLKITNTSVEAVTITALTDDNALSPACLALVNTTLAAGASASCTYTVTHTEADVYENAASVTVADNEGNTASADDSASVEVTNVMPAVTLDKSVTPASLPEPGGIFTYTLTITNELGGSSHHHGAHRRQCSLW